MVMIDRRVVDWPAIIVGITISAAPSAEDWDTVARYQLVRQLGGVIILDFEVNQRHSFALAFAPGMEIITTEKSSVELVVIDARKREMAIAHLHDDWDTFEEYRSGSSC